MTTAEAINWQRGPGGIYRAAPAPRTAPEPAPRPPQFLTVHEIAAAWRVSPMSVYRLVHAEELRGVRIGRSIRVSAQSVADYLARQENR